MKPRHLEPMPSYYFSPSYRGAPLTPSETGSQVYKSRKMEGTLGGIFNVLLAGERVSGTAIYGARKKLGFGAIDWIEQAEPGTRGYRRISPSEAIGIRGYDDRFWTGRGITSFALDIVLDPTTYIGVGLVGKGAKLTGMAAKGFGGRSIRVGAEGVEFMARAQGRGLSKEAAQRQLVDYMSVSTTVQAAMMERTGPTAVKFMGLPIMKTSRITGPVGKAWSAAPFLESRTAVMENLRTKFQIFHRVKSQVGDWAAKPYEEYYRRTGVGRSQWNKQVYHMSKGVPEELYEPMVRYIDTGVLPTTNTGDIIKQSKRYQKEVDRIAKEEVGAGLLDPATVRKMYYARLPTEEAMRYTERKMGKDFGAGLTREETVAKYIRSLGAAHQRAIKGNIFEAEKYMTGVTGVKQWYVMNPYESLQRRGISSIMSLESDRLLKTMKRTMGIRAVTTAQKYTGEQIDEMTAQRVSEYKLKHPIYTKQLIARKAFESEEEEFVRRITRATWMRPVGMERGVSWSPYERLLSITKEAESTGALRQYIETEKRGLFKGKYRTAKQYVTDIERISGEYTKLSADSVARSEWAKINRAELRAMSLAPGAPETLGIYTKTRVRELMHEITKLPSQKAVSEMRVSGIAGVRSARKMFEYETEFLSLASSRGMFGETGAMLSRAYTPGEIAKISAPIRKELEALTTKISPEKQMWKDDIFYKLKGEDYIPSEALAEYTRRVPTTGWWSRRETEFKKTLTSIWPAFHARNLYGMALWQNVLAGVDPRAYAMNLDIMRKTSPFMEKYAPWAVGDVGKLYDIPFKGKKTAAQLRAMAEEAEVYGITGMVDVATTYTTKGKLWSRIYEQGPQEMMVGVESIGRGAIFWDRIMKGMPVSKASTDVEKFHFRYGPGGMTEFESEKLRHVFLFYRWMRGNIPLQAQMSIEKPYMYAGLGKIQERAHTPESRGQMADWQKERFGFTVGGTFISLDLPFYEHPTLLAHPSNWEDLYFAATPAIKWPAGMLAGRDPATGAPITDWGDRASYTASQFMGRGVYAQRELAKTWTGERPVSWTALHQLGGVGVYELSPRAMQTGMTKMPGMPSDLRAMGITQEKWTEYKLATGWKPRLTDVSRAEIYQEKGGRCSICGQPCSPSHPCTSRLIVPVEQGGTYTPENTVLLHRSCSGTYKRNIAPLMTAQFEHLQVPSEYQMVAGDRDRIYGVIDSYMSAKDGGEGSDDYNIDARERELILGVVDDYVSDANLAE